ncbi:protein Z-dependent protease inhibitor isoform X2 [Pseudophryne corroboree]
MAIRSHNWRGVLVFFVILGLYLAHGGTKGGKSKHNQEKIPIPEELFMNPTNSTTDFTAYNISEMNSNFGFNLYRKMADKHDNNIFFSPFSVSFTLASLLLGTQGDTHEQLLSGLNWEAFKKQQHLYKLATLLKEVREGVTKSEGYSLDLGSLSLVQEQFSLKEEFLNQTIMYFDMEYQNIDFHNPNAKHAISAMISKKSRGRISELQDNFDPQTKLMLLDFILFKGKWQVPFKPDSTATDTFFINKYNSVKVPMMYKNDKIASMYDKLWSCIVLNLPYRGGAHMLIIMPEKEENFDALEDGLTMELVARWLLKMKSRKTDIFFPKFKLDHKYKLKTSLEDLGIKDVFTGKANLTRMTEERNLLLSEVTQRAVIEIDEIGTEASGVTGLEIIAYSMPYTIRLNRPFIFMIFDEKYKSLLFIGRIINPTSSKD